MPINKFNNSKESLKSLSNMVYVHILSLSQHTSHGSSSSATFTHFFCYRLVSNWPY